MLEYSVFASRLNEYLAVKSCLLCLKKDGEIPTSPFIKESSNGEEIIRFHYKVICIWKITVEELLAMDLPGLLPFLPFTKGGKKREVVDIMLERLVAAGKTDEIWVAYALAAKTLGQRHQSWLQRRIAMFGEFLADSPVYQEAFKQGVEIGLEKERQRAVQQVRQIIVEIVLRRFPALEALARAYASKLDNIDDLLQAVVHLSGIIRNSEQDAKQFLETAINTG